MEIHLSAIYYINIKIVIKHLLILINKEKPTNKFCRMKGIPKLFERIRHVLKKYNTILIAKPRIKLENVVHRKSDPINKQNKYEDYIKPFKVIRSMKTHTYVKKNKEHKHRYSKR